MLPPIVSLRLKAAKPAIALMTPRVMATDRVLRRDTTKKGDAPAPKRAMQLRKECAVARASVL